MGWFSLRIRYKIPHVLIAVHDHSEILRVESSSFKRYLARLYFNHEDEIIGNGSIESVIQILQAIAEYEGETYPLSLRTAWYDDGIIYDMTNDKWQYVKISKDGWEVIDNTPVPMFQDIARHRKYYLIVITKEMNLIGS